MLTVLEQTLLYEREIKKLKTLTLFLKKRTGMKHLLLTSIFLLSNSLIALDNASIENAQNPIFNPTTISTSENAKDLFFDPVTTSTSEIARASILQTVIVPYLIANDCAGESESMNDSLASIQELIAANESIIESAQDLLFDPAIPYASEIDFILARLFSLDPFNGQNPTEPLLTQLNDGLIPYLQAALTKLGTV